MLGSKHKPETKVLKPRHELKDVIQISKLIVIAILTQNHQFSYVSSLSDRRFKVYRYFGLVIASRWNTS